MDKELVKGINDQINFEFYSAYLYLSMAAYLRSINLNGFAHWMEIQAQEETTHAIKLYNYLNERGEKIELNEIAKPKAAWDTLIEVIENAYEHEKLVTSRINNLMSLANQAKDFVSLSCLQWFINEQVEEENNSLEILNQLKLAGDSSSAIFFLDKELLKRTFVNPNQPNNN